MQTSAQRTKRQAFTLVELLVVIAVIGILTALAAWGVFAMIGNTQRNNTNATMRVLNKMMQDRWTTVVAASRKEPPSPAVVALAGGPGLDPTGERAKVIWTKVRLVEAFPERYQEIYKSAVAPAPQSLVDTYIPATRQKSHLAKYREVLLKAGSPPGAISPAAPSASERSACLLMALRTLQAEGVALDDQIRHAINDTDGDQLTELVDGWTKPLAFVRFPWNNPALQAANPGLANAANVRGKTFADPIDTNGLLINPTWYNFTVPAPAIPPRVIYENQFHPVKTGAGDAYYVAPVIVSAGKDQTMDLAGDLSVTGPGATDNIFSFQLRGE